MNAPTRPLPDSESLRHVRQSLPHDSGIKHVQGAAQYIDDIREPEGTLHVAVGQSPKARGRLLSLDVSAVRAVPGVVAVLTAADIPGKNDVSPAFGDDPLFVDTDISFLGQALFAVVATDRDIARRAVKKAVMEIEPSRRASRSRTRSRAVKPFCPITLMAAAIRMRRSRSRPCSWTEVPRRRPGAFLSRRPDRAGGPARMAT